MQTRVFTAEFSGFFLVGKFDKKSLVNTYQGSLQLPFNWKLWLLACMRVFFVNTHHVSKAPAPAPATLIRAGFFGFVLKLTVNYPTLGPEGLNRLIMDV
jgi:hypothetical protein